MIARLLTYPFGLMVAGIIGFVLWFAGKGLWFIMSGLAKAVLG